MQDAVKEALDDLQKKNPNLLNQDLPVLTQQVLDWFSLHRNWNLNPYILRKDISDYLNGFFLTKNLTHGAMLSVLAGRVTDAKVAICAECGLLHPVIPMEAEMVGVHWSEWLKKEGWKQEGSLRLWTCPDCLAK